MRNELLVPILREALAAGRDSVRAQDLSAGAGRVVVAGSSAPPAPERPTMASLTREAAAEALRLSGGNVTQAAVRLGVHRTQLRRFLAKTGLPVERPDDDDGGDTSA